MWVSFWIAQFNPFPTVTYILHGTRSSDPTTSWSHALCNGRKWINKHLQCLVRGPPFCIYHHIEFSRHSLWVGVMFPDLVSAFRTWLFMTFIWTGMKSRICFRVQLSQLCCPLVKKRTEKNPPSALNVVKQCPRNHVCMLGKNGIFFRYMLKHNLLLISKYTFIHFKRM